MVALANGQPEPGYAPYRSRGHWLFGTGAGHAEKFRAAGKARRALLHARQAQRCLRSERQSPAPADDPVAAPPRDAGPGAVAGHFCQRRRGVQLVSTGPEGIPRLPGAAWGLSENAATRPFFEEDLRSGTNSERGRAPVNAGREVNQASSPALFAQAPMPSSKEPAASGKQRLSRTYWMPLALVASRSR